VTNESERNSAVALGEGQLRAAVDLFVRPGRFFRTYIADLSGPELGIVAWIVGINFAIGRVERQMMQADLGRGRGAAPFYAESWFKFWATLLIAGALSAAFAWFVGTWWYRVRLRWSGAVEPSVEPARVLYFYSHLVWAGPAVLATVGSTLRFPNYAAAWASESAWDALLLVFPIWACVVSYRGVRAVFDVRAGRARFWFLIAPIAVFLVTVGIFATLYALLD
jgi:hypothetical protein